MTSLNTISLAVVDDNELSSALSCAGPLRIRFRWGSSSASDPNARREVEEGQQCFAILGQAFDRLVVFRLVFLGEDIDGYLGQRVARRQVNFAQILLHVRLH